MRYSSHVNPDVTPIREAFKELRRSGYVARMNFWCCSNCAWYDLGQRNESNHAVFYNKQSGESLSRTGRIMLQWSGDSKFICETLKKYNISVSHDGDENKAIEVLLR